MERVGAEAVLNCIGIVKQIDAAKDAIVSISINALLPHQLAALCAERGARLIHFSTDCVFSGRVGPYRDSDPPDPMDLYGRSKLLGEVDRPGCLTLRTSIVGREIQPWDRSLGVVHRPAGRAGARLPPCAVFRADDRGHGGSGPVADRRSHPGLSGVWQVSGDPIDKYSLLCMVDRVYGLGIRIDPDESFPLRPALDSSRFRAATGWTPPRWQSMIETMHADPLL